MRTHYLYTVTFLFIVCLVSACSYNSASVTPYYQSVTQGYTVQLGAFKNVTNASNFVDKLNANGLDAFLFKEDGYFKVRYGNYSSRSNAEASAKKVIKQFSLGGYYIVKPEDLTTYKSKSASNSETYMRAELVRSAEKYIGVPYVWGGTTSAGFDCSGLTRAVYRLNGVDIPRVSRDQFKGGRHVNKSQLKAGDLVFFATSGSVVNHVGIYIGGNKFIHSPRKGATVRKEAFSDYWNKRYVGSRNYL